MNVPLTTGSKRPAKAARVWVGESRLGAPLLRAPEPERYVLAEFVRADEII